MQFKTHTRTNYRLPSPAAFAGGGFALIVLVIGGLWLAESLERVRTPLPHLALAVETAPAPVAADAEPARLVYRHSVIPGGVRGAAELASKLARDPVASVHYANFDVAKARLVHVEKARSVHVSYRIGDNIYWTKHKVRLAVGEDLLTDGTQLVRTRCANRIADTPQGMIADNEPAPEMLDTLFVSAGDPLDPRQNVASAHAPAAASAPAATRLASTLHSVTASAAPTMPQMAPMATSLHSSLPTLAPATSATSTVPVQMAPALVRRGGDDVPAVVDSGPSTLSTQTIPSTPTPPPTPTTSPTPSPPWIPPTPLPPHESPLPPASPTADTPPPIPEPGSSALMILALIALMLMRRGATGRKQAVAL